MSLVLWSTVVVLCCTVEMLYANTGTRVLQRSDKGTHARCILLVSLQPGTLVQWYFGAVVLWHRGGVIGAFYRISLPFTVLRLNLLQPEAFFLSLMTHTDFDNGDHIMKQLLLVNIGYFLSPSQPLQISLSVKVSTLYTTLSFGGFSEVFSSYQQYTVS